MIRWTQKSQLACKTPSKPSSRRTFTTSHKTQAARVSTTTTATSPTPESAPSESNDSLPSLSSSLWAQKPSRTPFSPLKPTSSAFEMLTMLNPTAKPGSQLPPSFDNILGPNPSKEARELAGSIDMKNYARELLSAAPVVPRVKLRLNPSTGRAIAVTQQTDVAFAFKLLEIGVNKNKVKNDFNRQRFHERGGVKRKRLGRERWRRRFGDGFKAVVARVKHLRKQGW
ncbi:hypothetical protein GLAREA_12573 [Glarea lozoyensis ATCC 20868]|uniref:Ribosomal protein S21 n=1 Tax=Glarea lozoyensis (strain ATCC 20868 / MF5171) TaxID=1116229 RepID=S3D0B5_GLAL2|nr:uncharacterized protein GLAREA_12573 [Glarea lozoyensis ATCC 20868]EPE31270.1 hypothetical protein GLAREA_12573 [Glarea lozoyensis ATCC 20868]